jgi:hypothetical protein
LHRPFATVDENFIKLIITLNEARVLGKYQNRALIFKTKSSISLKKED